MSRERPSKKMEPCLKAKTKGFICQTSYESDGPQGHIARLFFGSEKLCHCAKCVAKRGREDMKRLKERGLIA